MGTSMAAGLRAVTHDVDRVVILLGDQPNVDAALLRCLLVVHESSGRDAAAVSCNGLVMAPAVISGAIMKAATRASGAVGLRHVLRTTPESVAVLPVAADAVRDIDTVADLAREVRARG